MKISVSYGRTFQIRPYEPVRLEASVELGLPPGAAKEDRDRHFEQAWDECRDQVRRQFAGLATANQQIAVDILNGLPESVRRAVVAGWSAPAGAN